MRRESHVRFCERAVVRFRRATHLVILCRRGSAEKALHHLRAIMRGSAVREIRTLRSTRRGLETWRGRNSSA